MIRKGKDKKYKKPLLCVIVLLVIVMLILIPYKLFSYSSSSKVKEFVSVDLYRGYQLYKEDDALFFVPDNATKAVIIYPGAMVEYDSYAFLGDRLAKAGIACVIPHLTANLAFLEQNAATDIMKLLPSIDEWYIGGHSLGGAVASFYSEKNSDKLTGLILLAAYSTKDLSDTDLKVLLVTGTEDGVLNVKNYEKYKVNLPSDYTECVIEGGCHSYFGDYGDQKGDGTPTVTRDLQLDTTAMAIVSLLDD